MILTEVHPMCVNPRRCRKVLMGISERLSGLHLILKTLKVLASTTSILAISMRAAVCSRKLGSISWPFINRFVSANCRRFQVIGVFS